MENNENEIWKKMFDGIKRRFAVLGEGYAELIAYIRTELPQTNKNRVLPRICERAVLEAERMVKWYDNDAAPEFFAWTGRNLFEIYLITEYVIKGENNLKRFLNKALDDIKDIGEGLKELAIGNLEAIKIIKETQERYEFSKHKLKGKMPRIAKELAKAVGDDKEYKSFFKIYSKYVHPTPWLILENKKYYLHLEGKKAFFRQGYIYCETVFDIISESTGFDETKGFKNIKYRVAPNG